MSSEREVRKASENFYAALNSMANGDAGPMAEVWSQSADATTQHPVGGREVGSDEVLASFSKVAAISKGGSVRLDGQMIVAGDDMAVETGVEKGTINMAGHTVEIGHRVTNVYRKEAGAWKLVHHHTDVSPQMLEILAKLK
jgi:ketosteroid isomerase-like protein